MKRGVWLLMYAWLILVASSAENTQSIVEKQSIHIYLSPRNYSDYSQKILGTVENNLSPYGYRLFVSSLTENEYYLPITDTPSLWIEMYNPNPNSYDGIFFSVVPLSSPSLAAVSPILVNKYGPAPTLVIQEVFSTTDVVGKNLSVNLLTALSLYAADHCQDAVPYFDNALEALEQFAPKHPPVGGAYDSIPFYLGNCAVTHFNYKQAETYYESALLNRGTDALEPESVPTAINLSWVYLQLGKKDKAFNLIDKAVQTAYNARSMSDFWRLFPVLVLPRRAQLYALDFRYNDAVADMTAAIQLDPGNPELHVLRGQMYLLLYEWDSVLSDYNKAIELDPNYADAYFYRGVLFYTRDDLTSARPDFEQYLKLAPTGDHAAEAQKYLDQIRTTQDALNQ